MRLDRPTSLKDVRTHYENEALFAEAVACLEAIEHCIGGIVREKRTATEQACLDRARALLAKLKQ